MTKTETTTQSIQEYFYDDLRPKGLSDEALAKSEAIGNQSPTHLSAKKYDSLKSYFYDGDGLRVFRKDNVSGITTYYVWDTENPTGYPQVVEEIEGGQVVRRYGYGLFLENIDIWNGTSFERFYVVRDGTNSVRMLLDSAGNVTAEYDYDAFGNILNTTINTPICSQNAFGFHSEFRDPVTGLVYLRARWYEPKTGRFVGMDRFEGSQENPTSLNKYISFNDNPINLTDPSGLVGIMDVGLTINMIGPLASYSQPSFPPKTTAWILYNGTRVIWYERKQGGESKELASYWGNSGLPEYQEVKYQSFYDEGLEGGGPIPSGRYSINLKPSPYNRIAKHDSITGKLLSNSQGGIEMVPKEVILANGTRRQYSAWGSIRAKLEPMQGTNTYDRSGFYLHNSNKGYTHGCVETATEIFNLLLIYRQRPGNNTIDFNVIYNGASTRGGLN